MVCMLIIIITIIIIVIIILLLLQGSKLKKLFGRKFATSYENLVATLKMLVAKLIEAI